MKIPVGIDRIKTCHFCGSERAIVECFTCYDAFSCVRCLNLSRGTDCKPCIIRTNDLKNAGAAHARQMMVRPGSAASTVGAGVFSMALSDLNRRRASSLRTQAEMDANREARGFFSGFLGRRKRK